MVVKLEVFKTVHNTWPAKNGMAAGESFDLLCIDVSNPPEHRMEEMLFYRTKPEERGSPLRQRHRQNHHGGRGQDPARGQGRQSHHHREHHPGSHKEVILWLKILG